MPSPKSTFNEEDIFKHYKDSKQREALEMCYFPADKSYVVSLKGRTQEEIKNIVRYIPAMQFMPEQCLALHPDNRDVTPPLWHYGFKLGPDDIKDRVQSIASSTGIGNPPKTFKEFTDSLCLYVRPSSHRHKAVEKMYEEYATVWLEGEMEKIIGQQISDPTLGWADVWEGGKEVKVIAVANSWSYQEVELQKLRKLTVLFYGPKPQKRVMWYLDAEEFSWKTKN